MTLPSTPTQWPVWAWDMYAERRAVRECEGETPSDAARNAEEDVRRWHAAGGDAAWVARLPQGTGTGNSWCRRGAKAT